MVDYNIAIPQQQLFQAPDVMQNAMRVQQMQAQNMQMGELARKRQEESALRGITADPSSPEYVQQLARISPELGMRALNMQRQNTLLEQQTRAAGLQAAKTGLDIDTGRVDLIRKFNADLPGVLTSADPAKAYASWRARIKQVSGQEPGVPEVYPGEAALRGIMDTTEAFLTRTTPQAREQNGVLGQLDPRTNIFNVSGINRFAPPADTGAGVGAGTGPATAAMNPTRLADMQATQARLNLPVMQSDAGAAGAAVNNMTGAAGAPAAVGNAMRPAASPYGAPISADEFARQQKVQEDQRKLQQRGAEKRQDLEIAQQEKIQAALPQIEESATQTLKNIEGLIGGAQVDAKGRIVYDKGAKRAHPGFESAVGASFSKILPGGATPGFDRADFETRFDQVKGGTFLDAYNSLRGGGAIDQKEGEKATAALNRMNLAQSEVEFIRAARDFEEVIRKGVARARTMAQGGAGSNMTSPATQGTEGAKRGISKTEYDALPSGSVYTAPNGEQRTKR